MGEPVDLSQWSCPVPLRDYDRIVTGHGGGGRLSLELVEHLFLPALGSDGTGELHDAAAVDAGAVRLAFSTDTYVVQPLFFPGGCIGDLAVNGTVNDVAMRGGAPIALSAGFVLEEGLPLATVGHVAEAMGVAARDAGVPLVTGDTKVVDTCKATSGEASGLFVNTAGIGVIPPGVDIRPRRAAPGDRVILSGPIGLHGVAVLASRAGLEFETTVQSDSAPLNGLVSAMLDASPDIHVLRDPTRGGLGTSLCEIAATAGVGIDYSERAVPIPEEVAAACSFLGLDVMHVANEGKLVAIVPEVAADAVLDAMVHHPRGRQATVIGSVTADHPGMVVARTALGGRRVVDLPLGEQLPRIC